jgi:hypothetical protein
MLKSTHTAYRAFIDKAEVEGLSVSDVANILHHEAYSLLRDSCGVATAMKWQITTTDKMLEQESRAVDVANTVTERLKIG